MDQQLLGFISLSTLLIAIAVAIVRSRRLVHYVMFLFFFIAVVAAIFILLDAVFLSVAELIIYNGGIVVLLAIGISLLPEGATNSSRMRYLVGLPVAIVVLFVGLLYSTTGGFSSSLDYTNFGAYLFQNYGSVLLVLSLVAVASIFSSIYFITKEDTQ